MESSKLKRHQLVHTGEKPFQVRAYLWQSSLCGCGYVVGQWLDCGHGYVVGQWLDCGHGIILHLLLKVIMTSYCTCY